MSASWGNLNAEYWPEDDENNLYLFGEVDQETITEKCKEKWPNAKPDELDFEAIYEHTHCLGYDRYDPADYTNFIHIQYNPRGAKL